MPISLSGILYYMKFQKQVQTIRLDWDTQESKTFGRTENMKESSNAKIFLLKMKSMLILEKDICMLILEEKH